MFESIRKYVYKQRALRCERLGHECVTVERLGRKDGLYVVEHRVQCERCQLPISDWEVVLTEASPEVLWGKLA